MVTDFIPEEKKIVPACLVSQGVHRGWQSMKVIKEQFGLRFTCVILGNVEQFYITFNDLEKLDIMILQKRDEFDDQHNKLN